MTPNFFIVGAPKCGTTALSEYLRTHPQIFMSTPKEPNYFAEDMPDYRAAVDWEGYLRLFEGGAHHVAVGEASAFYLYSAVALRRLKQALPLAKLIIMLRNPLELAPSMHAQALRTRNETVSDFAAAWDLCESRRLGQYIPSCCRDVKRLLYDQIALLGFQVERALAIFPRNQVQWWFYDDFAADPKRVYQEVLAYLGVPDDGRAEFPRVNSRARARFQVLAQFTQKTPQLLVECAMQLKRMLGIEEWGFLEALRRANFVPLKPMQLPPALVQRLYEHFRADICLLEELTGRDLTHWRRQTTA